MNDFSIDTTSQKRTILPPVSQRPGETITVKVTRTAREIWAVGPCGLQLIELRPRAEIKVVTT